MMNEQNETSTKVKIKLNGKETTKSCFDDFNWNAFVPGDIVYNPHGRPIAVFKSLSPDKSVVELSS